MGFVGTELHAPQKSLTTKCHPLQITSHVHNNDPILSKLILHLRRYRFRIPLRGGEKCLNPQRINLSKVSTLENR